MLPQPTCTMLSASAAHLLVSDWSLGVGPSLRSPLCRVHHFIAGQRQSPQCYSTFSLDTCPFSFAFFSLYHHPLLSTSLSLPGPLLSLSLLSNSPPSPKRIIASEAAHAPADREERDTHKSGSNNHELDKTMMNSLMLRFRPIAPKPAVGGPLLGRSPTFKDNANVSAQRTKRKYVRVRRSCQESNNKGRGGTVAKEEPKSRSTTTLQLLEENRSEQKVSSKGGAWCSSSTSMYSQTVTVTDKEDEEARNPFIRLNLNLNLMSDRKEALGEMAVMPPWRKTVETWVTVEHVRETCMDALGLGWTDMEKITNLGGETCPGFVSDGSNRVVWVNGAFRKMVMRLNEEEEAEMEVRLVMREGVAYSAFTCQLKVQYTWWWKKEKFWQMVPCDAWRIDGGGFAWRLDVKAALSLGR